MKQKISTIIFLIISTLLGLSNATYLRPARAVDKIGFSKRQDQWIGGAPLYASGCPGDLQNCGTGAAQAWCCPKGTVCNRNFCCPSDAYCDAIVKTFPSCADPSWTLCTYTYIGPTYYCCLSDQQCYLAVGSAPACGPSNLPVQSSQKVSTVSPLYTRTDFSAAGSSVSSQSTPSPSPSPSPSSSVSSFSISISHSSSEPVSSPTHQVVPSITRSTGTIQTSSGSATYAVAGNTQSATTSSGTSDTGSGSSSHLSGGAIAGIVIGAVVGLALIALVGILGIRYGSKKAIENYTAANMANTSPPVYHAQQGFSVAKPEGVEMSGTDYPRASGERMELGSDGGNRS